MHVSLQGALADSRKVLRFAVSAPVTFTWCAAEGLIVAEGVTKEISTDAVFIWSNVYPPVETEVNCEIFMPRLKADAPGVKVDVTGPVHRLEYPPAEHHLYGFVVLGRVLRLVPDGPSSEEPFATGLESND